MPETWKRFGRGLVFSLICGATLLPAPAVRAEERRDIRPEAAQTAQKPEGVAGVASYYASRYEGRRTTSGERYRGEKFTAAHPDLPLGTWVKVVHAESGKEVAVRVNDRCRKKKFPVIDLSRAAARELGILGEGRARVVMVRLEPETAQTPLAKVAEQ